VMSGHDRKTLSTLSAALSTRGRQLRESGLGFARPPAGTGPSGILAPLCRRASRPQATYETFLPYRRENSSTKLAFLAAHLRLDTAPRADERCASRKSGGSVCAPE
jgi:hypothetical protein